MLTNKMLDKLNEQINLEFYSSNLYLQMASWCESKGLEGCADFLKSHADEEMGHMHRLFTYVNECGAMAKMGAIHIECPVTEFVIDRDRKLVSSPAYMLAQNISEAAEGIEKTVAALVEMA